MLDHQIIIIFVVVVVVVAVKEIAALVVKYERSVLGHFYTKVQEKGHSVKDTEKDAKQISK